MIDKMEVSITKLRALVVDDEPEMRRLLSRVLGNMGYFCREASNGLEALEVLQTERFELILLDISMPVKSGLQVLSEIKGRDINSAIIMVTGVADIQTAITAMERGAYDYLLKPIDQSLFRSVVVRALEKRRLLQENREYQLQLEQKVKIQTEKIRDSFLNSVKSLAAAIEAKDKYTSGHSQRVTDVAIVIAQRLELGDDIVDKIKIAGMLHDIGKIGISDTILLKPGGLSEEERGQIKNHPLIGERILEPLIEDPEILSMIKHHHERYDGSGYPDGLGYHLPEDGLCGQERVKDTGGLSTGVMVLTLADAWDAMTSNRPYRNAMNQETACAEIEKGRGTQFKPEIVDAFLGLLADRIILV